MRPADVLIFFHEDLGRNFLPELCREVHHGTVPLCPSSKTLCCAPCSTEQSLFKGERRKGAEKRGRRGVDSKWGEKEKGSEALKALNSLVAGSRPFWPDFPGGH